MHIFAGDTSKACVGLDIDYDYQYLWSPYKCRLICLLCAASSGSDSPDQALEAEEIVKQLEMEQTVETPTSTVTSTQEMCPTTDFYSSVSQLPSLRAPHIPELSPRAGEGELGDADLPPLTGRSLFTIVWTVLSMCIIGFCSGSSPRHQSTFDICGLPVQCSSTRSILRGGLGGLWPVSHHTLTFLEM